jgi:hypothetical protein
VYALYAPYAPYWYRPYYASGYAGPLPGNSYQAVSRLHKREAEADPQLILHAAPFAPAAFLPGPAGAVFNAPVVRSVVEAPAVVSHAVHAAPVPLAAPLSFAPLVAPTSAVVGVGPHDCVTAGGCALRAALATGLPAATFGPTSTAVIGRKRREAEAEAEADAEADPGLLYNSWYGNNYYANPYYAPHPYTYSPYAYNPYYANPYYANPYYAALAPYYAAAPVVAPAPVVAAPAVATVAKQVTYTHLGAHPIIPTTVVETEHRLVA